MIKLQKIWDDFLNNGIFKKIYSLTGSTWDVDPDILDLHYLFYRSGEKKVSPLLYKLYNENGELTENDKIKITNIVLSLFTKSWERLYNVYNVEYNPIDNYNMIENETVEDNKDETGTNTLRKNESHLDNESYNTSTEEDNTITNSRTYNETNSRSNESTETNTKNLSNTTTYDIDESETNQHSNNSSQTNTKNEDLRLTTKNNKHEEIAANRYAFNSSQPSPTDGSGSNVSESGGTNQDNEITEQGSQQESGTNSILSTKDGTEVLRNTGTDTTTVEDSEVLSHTGTVTDSEIDDKNVIQTGSKNNSGSTTGEETTTSQISNESETIRTLTRKGNIGVTTTQQMLQSEIELWKWNFLEKVMSDIDKILVLSVY